MARKKRKIIARNRAKTALRIAEAVIAVLALIGLGVFCFFKYRSCNIPFKTRSVPFIVSDVMTGTGSGILYTRGSSLEHYSFKDEDDNFSIPLSGKPAGVVGTEGIKAVYSTEAVQILGADFKITPEGRIVSVRGGQTHLGVLAKKPNGSEQLTVYNGAGQQVYSLDFESGRLMSFGFSETSGNTLWTMELDSDSGSPRTTVTTFDLARMSSTGVIIVSGELIEDVFFTDQSVFLIGTESLIRYSAVQNREIYRVRLHGYRVIDRTRRDSSPVLLLMPRDAASLKEAGAVRLLTVSQKDVAEELSVGVTLPEDVVGCHLLAGGLVVVRPTCAMRYTYKGAFEGTLEMPSNVTVSSRKLDDRHILLERSGEFVLLVPTK